jgi:hypothetical protein
MKRWLPLSSALLFAAPAAHAAHPLVTEDTGIQGKGGWQLELNADRFRDSGLQLTGTNAVLTYGVAESADLQVGASDIDSNGGSGRSDTAISLKWRAWERDAWSFGFKPTVTLPTGDWRKGTGSGHASWNALAVASFEGEKWLFNAHAGVFQNNNTVGDPVSARQAAGAVLYRVTERLKPLVDYSYTNSGGEAAHTTTVGFIYSPGKNLDLDVGARHGGGAAPNRALMAGLTLRW